MDPTKQPDALKLPRVDADYMTRLSQCEPVRWLGPDGGVRMGVLVPTTAVEIAFDPLTGTFYEVSYTEYEPNTPKDDDGNPKA